MAGWRKVLRDFAGCSDRLENAVGDLSTEQLDRTPGEGGWSPRQIIHHLADGSSIWGMFIHQALVGKGGEFNLHWYWELDQEEWSEIWKYSSREIEPSLSVYRANQERIIGLLQLIDQPTEYSLEIQIEGHDPESITILEAVRIQIIHLKGHLADIRKILKQ
jgi:uncharacterized damage-inducible protein DinB